MLSDSSAPVRFSALSVIRGLLSLISITASDVVVATILTSPKLTHPLARFSAAEVELEE